MITYTVYIDHLMKYRLSFLSDVFEILYCFANRANVHKINYLM
jgi:hypothetical protein